MSTPSGVFLVEITRSEKRARPRVPNEVREAALRWVADRGLPTTKDEAWRYARIRPILDIPFKLADSSAVHRLSSSSNSIAALAANLEPGPRIVVVNGYYTPELSSLAPLSAGLKVTRFGASFAAHDMFASIVARPFRQQPNAFTALSAAFVDDGVLLEIPADTNVEEPIHVIFASAPSATPLLSHPRLVVLAMPSSRATIVETYVGRAGQVYFNNAITDIVLDDAAHIEHYKVQDEAQTAFHIARLDVRQGPRSHFSSHSMALGAYSARHEVCVRLEGEGARLALNGLYLPRGDQHLDNPTTIDHLVPSCTSRELYKGVVDGHGRGSFDGRIVVRPGAFKTDASQTNKNLLLSTTGRVDTRPRLEIFADDVKCSHGASVGQLDEEAVFYMRSRGIPISSARHSLAYAFMSEMIGLLRPEALRFYVERLVMQHLQSAEVTT